MNEYNTAHSFHYSPVGTVKPVNKGHPRERQNMVFIDKWSVFGDYFVLFYQERVIEAWPLFTVWSLFRERQNMVFIDKWSVFGGNFVLFYQGMFYFTKEGLLKCGLCLQCGLYLEVAFNIGLTVYRFQWY